MLCFQIEGKDQDEKKQMKLFPDDDRTGRILCHALTADLLYYGTDVRLILVSLMTPHSLREHQYKIFSYQISFFFCL